MAIVDFTLDDLRTVVREEVGLAFDEKFKPAFDSAFEPWAMGIKQDFDRIGERLDHLEGDVKILKSDMAEVKTDIKGIMELRTRPA